MIPRYQKLIFALLLAASVAMAGLLWHLRERAHERLIAGQDSAPALAPAAAPDEQAILLVADDSDGSLTTQTHSLSLPADPNARAQAVLGKLLDLYAAPGAAHPVPGGAGSVLQVFLMPAPPLADAPPAAGHRRSSPSGPENPPGAGNSSRLPGAATAAIEPPRDPQTAPLLAVVNLSGSFADNHPSGIETEMLTVLS
ncbi:MAG: hypothetical protein ACP5FH_11335, partial [Terracidiphilus sp.]